MEPWREVVRTLADCLGACLLVWPIEERRDFKPPAVWEKKELPEEVWHLGQRVCSVLLFCLLLLAEKQSHLIFWQDFPATVILLAVFYYGTRRLRIENAVYIGCVAFLCMDFCVAIANSALLGKFVSSGSVRMAVVEFGYAVLLTGICCLSRHFVLMGGKAELRRREFLLLFLSLLPYLAIRTGSLLYLREGETGQIMEFILLLTIASTFGTLVGNRNALLAEKEKAARLSLEMSMREREKQYEIRRETLDEVRRKYHDMVKYARMFDAAREKGKDLADYLEKRMTGDLEEGSLVQTGNRVLDMILWDKLERCRERGLRLLPMVTGEKLSFIADYDLHTIVGNALDNAIEAAQELSDPEKREISLRLQPHGNMIFLQVTNYYQGERKKEGERFLSTKSDGVSHGYGLDNIRRAAESYGGAVDIGIEDDRFSLTVMLSPADKEEG